MRLNKKQRTISYKKRKLHWGIYVSSSFASLMIIGFFSNKVTKDFDLLQIIFQRNDLETINLNIKFKDLQKIEKKRDEAIKFKRLVSDQSDFVNATITLNGQNYRCKLRLKGDLQDHWSGDKLSFRIELKDGKLINGMSRFSLQDPSTRNETSEYLFLNHLSLNDCLALKYDFVNVNINGKQKGIFAIEEHFSKEFIESNKRRDGVIIKFDDTLVWHNYKSTNINRDSVFRSLPVKVRGLKKIEEQPSLLKQKDNAVNLLRSIQENSLPASLVFDPPLIGRFLATVRLWCAEHCLELDDINFYFNSITSKLEPIGFDGLAGRTPKTPYCYFTGGQPKENWVNYALKDNRIAEEYIKYLYKFSSLDIKNLFNKDIIAKERMVRNLRIKEIALNYPKVFIRSFHLLINQNPWENPIKIQK